MVVRRASGVGRTGYAGRLCLVVAYMKAWLKRHPAVFASCWLVDRKWCGRSALRRRRQLVRIRRYGGSWWRNVAGPAFSSTVLTSLKGCAFVFSS